MQRNSLKFHIKKFSAGDPHFVSILNRRSCGIRLIAFTVITPYNTTQSKLNFLIISDKNTIWISICGWFLLLKLKHLQQTPWFFEETVLKAHSCIAWYGIYLTLHDYTVKAPSRILNITKLSKLLPTIYKIAFLKSNRKCTFNSSRTNKKLHLPYINISLSSSFTIP